MNEYFVKNHGHTVPCKRSEAPQGITIAAVPVYLYEKGKTDADLTVKHIEKLDDSGLIPHYFISISSTWQVLDLADCWQRPDGTADNKTICIAITMTDAIVPPMFSLTPMHHAAMLTAYLLKKYKLTVNDVQAAENCPQFFKTRYKDFTLKIRSQVKKL